MDRYDRLLRSGARRLKGHERRLFMAEVAKEKNVPLVDLHASSVKLCEKIGQTETEKFNPVKDGKQDTTHLNAGARVVFARLVVADLRQVVPELAPYLLAEPDASRVQ